MKTKLKKIRTIISKSKNYLEFGYISRYISRYISKSKNYLLFFLNLELGYIRRYISSHKKIILFLLFLLSLFILQKIFLSSEIFIVLVSLIIFKSILINLSKKNLTENYIKKETEKIIEEKIKKIIFKIKLFFLFFISEIVLNNIFKLFIHFEVLNIMLVLFNYIFSYLYEKLETIYNYLNMPNDNTINISQNKIIPNNLEYPNLNTKSIFVTQDNPPPIVNSQNFILGMSDVTLLSNTRHKAAIEFEKILHFSNMMRNMSPEDRQNFMENLTYSINKKYKEYFITGNLDLVFIYREIIYGKAFITSPPNNIPWDNILPYINNLEGSKEYLTLLTNYHRFLYNVFTITDSDLEPFHSLNSNINIEVINNNLIILNRMEKYLKENGNNQLVRVMCNQLLNERTTLLSPEEINEMIVKQRKSLLLRKEYINDPFPKIQYPKNFKFFVNDGHSYYNNQLEYLQSRRHSINSMTAVEYKKHLISLNYDFSRESRENYTPNRLKKVMEDRFLPQFSNYSMMAHPLLKATGDIKITPRGMLFRDHSIHNIDPEALKKYSLDTLKNQEESIILGAKKAKFSYPDIAVGTENNGIALKKGNIEIAEDKEKNNN